jgi:hypothetical protein
MYSKRMFLRIHTHIQIYSKVAVLQRCALDLVQRVKDGTVFSDMAEENPDIRQMSKEELQKEVLHMRVANSKRELCVCVFACACACVRTRTLLHLFIMFLLLIVYRHTHV